MLHERAGINRKHLVSAFALAIALLLAFCGLAGCTGPKFKEDEAREVQQLGEQIMQAWIDVNHPRATIDTIKFYTYGYPGGPVYLTDYVQGTFREGSQTRSFLVNTLTGEVFLGADSDELAQAVQESLLENYDFGEGAEVESCHVSMRFPTKTEGSKRDVPDGEFVLGMLPADVEDVYEFVDNPEQRATLDVDISIYMPDTDVSTWGLEQIDTVEDQLNLNFSDLYLHNDSESLDAYNDEMTYTRNAWTDTAGFRLRSWVEFRDEKHEGDDGAVKVNRRTYDPAQDLVVRLDSKGYTFHFIDQSKKFPIMVFAYEGAAALEHTYTVQESDSGAEWAMHWEPLDDGTYVLVTDDGQQSWFSSDIRLLYAD